MEKKSLDLVTIIIPCYNSSRTITRCLESVFKQTEFQKIHKVIIIDDASNDFFYLKKKINNFKKKIKNIQIFRNKKNMGPGYSRNLAISKSNSKYISFLDSDDVWHRDKLKIQLSYFDKDPDLFMICAFNESSKFNNTEFDEIKLLKMLFHNGVFTSSVLMKSQPKLFFKKSYFSEDYYLWLSMLINKFKIIRVNKILVNKLDNKKGLTYNQDLMQLNIQKVFLSLYFKLPNYFFLIFLAQIFSLIKYFIKKFKYI